MGIYCAGISGIVNNAAEFPQKPWFTYDKSTSIARRGATTKTNAIQVAMVNPCKKTRKQFPLKYEVAIRAPLNVIAEKEYEQFCIPTNTGKLSRPVFLCPDQTGLNYRWRQPHQHPYYSQLTDEITRPGLCPPTGNPVLPGGKTVPAPGRKPAWKRRNTSNPEEQAAHRFRAAIP